MTRRLEDTSGINGKSICSIGIWRVKMKISSEVKLKLFILLIILNIILRLQVIPHEMGVDSFLVHIRVNAISEFGYAKWFVHPLSILGLYPLSYTSSVPFYLSGIHQATLLNMETVIFVYCIFFGFLCVFISYILAGVIFDDDVFKFLTVFIYSLSPAILNYTTWTMPARAPFVVLVPLVLYLLIKSRTSPKYILLAFILSILLFTTHHLFYFMLPVYVSFFIVMFLTILKNHTTIKIPENIMPYLILAGFVSMLAVPLIFGKFLEISRFDMTTYRTYLRYIGPIIIFAFGGLFYQIYKRNKQFSEWFLLLSVMFLTAFIYKQTYLKWFIPIFIVLFICIGMINFINSSEKRKYVMPIIVLFLFINITFAGYFQFLHFQEVTYRQIDEPHYLTGVWMKENANGSAIHNSLFYGFRLFAVSETTHFLTGDTLTDNTYGFINVDLSEFEWYPVTSEDFWYDGGKFDHDYGEDIWENMHQLDKVKPQDLNITYVTENKYTGGRFIWNHPPQTSNLLTYAYENGNAVYDVGMLRVWDLT